MAETKTAKTTKANTHKSKSLVAKIAEVVAEVAPVTKDGKNTQQHYDYVTEAKVKASLRNLLSARGIAIIPEYQIVDRWDTKTSRGKLLNYVAVQGTFVITDGKETIKGTMPGIGMDIGDKAVYKAETGAQKNFLMQLTMLTTDNDPEQNQNFYEGTQNQTNDHSSNNYKNQSNLITHYQLKQLDSQMKQMEKTTEFKESQLVHLICKKNNVTNLRQLKKTDYSSVRKYLLEKFESYSKQHQEPQKPETNDQASQDNDVPPESDNPVDGDYPF